MMLIEVRGIKMNIELSGREDAPVAMLSHSLGSSLIMWEPQMESLRPYFRVLRYDICGHGGTQARKGIYTIDELGKDAISIMDALKIDNVHWIGLSMGGMIGQYIALEYKERLLSLVLCDTSAYIPEEAQKIWDERIKKVREKGLEAIVDETMERWFTPSFSLKNPSAFYSIRRQFLQTSLEGYLGCVDAIRKLNYLERLREINIPALIIVGEEDIGTPVFLSEEMHKRIAHSKLFIIPSARHLSNYEQPESFNNAILKFMLNLQSSSHEIS
jgi:3-oxoadipate enol-lactonase